MSPPPCHDRQARLGFAGLGWIGRQRMHALLESGIVEAAAILEPNPDACGEALQLAPEAVCVNSYEELLEQDLDGVVIATPSAMHAEQSIRALERGLAVFCQKPLARTGEETRRVIAAAMASDRLLGVDLSYRHTAAFGKAVELARGGALGRVYAIDLTFHNAYGPDKPWFRDPALSGGGCLIDLGVHLLDLALLALDRDPIVGVQGALYSGGELLYPNPAVVEDYAAAQLRTESGASIRIACSWNIHAGQDAVIAASFFGTRGGALVRNINGSFYDFEAMVARGTSREVIAAPPDGWGGRAAVAWAEQLARNAAFDASIESLIDVADALDRIYGRSAPMARKGTTRTEKQHA